MTHLRIATAVCMLAVAAVGCAPLMRTPERFLQLDPVRDDEYTYRATTADGVVVHSGWAGEYGKAIEIQHGDRYETVYGHLEQTLVTAGQHVKRGDRVGLVGSTGRSTAPHLHYEVRVDGHAVNPLEYVLETR